MAKQRVVKSCPPSGEEVSGPCPAPPQLFDRAQAGRRRDFLVNLLYLLTWVALGAATVWLLGRWLLPFLLAFFTAAALQRPVRWLTGKTHVPRGFLSGALVVGLVLLVAGAAALLGWQLWRTAIAFWGDEEMAAEAAEALARAAAAVREVLRGWSARLSPQTKTALEAALGGLLTGMENGESGAWGEWLFAAVGNLAGGLLDFFTHRLPGILLDFFIWVMASLFLTVDYRRVTAFLTRQIPTRRQALAADTAALLGRTAGQMLRAYGLLMLLTFAELLLGLWLLKVPYAPLVAAGIAVVDILPVLGVGTVLLPWAAVSLLEGNVAFGIWMTVLYLGITLVRQAVQPRLVGERVGLPPLVALMCLYLGWKAAGVAGAVLAPLAVTVLVQLQKRGHLPLWK